MPLKGQDMEEKKKGDSKNENRSDFFDDGRTVSDMSADWMPWNTGVKKKRKKNDKDKNAKNQADAQTSKEEYKKLVLSQFLAMLPMFLCIIAAACIVFLLAVLWLK